VTRKIDPANVQGPSKTLSPLQKAYLKLEEMQARLEAAERTRREPIAIIGAACRLPGGVCTVEDYWRLLEEGRDAISEVPPERWSIDAYYDADPQAPGKMSTRWGGFLADVDQFDAAFFGISPREAANMDPQQRLLLEVSWEALENAGIAADGLAGSATGVFVGIGFNDYARLLAAQDAQQINAYSGSGIQLCFAAGRVSYALGLRGPSFAIDTACSSSLVALHQACQSLRAGECDMALTGGVNLLLAPEGNIFLSKAGALSPSGRCKTFDAAADGMVRSDGCGVVVLKRLRDAMADGDTVMAVIRGSAINHDGRSSGLTVPNAVAQEAVIRQALKSAGVQPDQVGYVEAHGTGTPLGDPIEVQSTAAVYGYRPEDVPPVVITSVKTNLGHLEAASGIASVIKVALVLRHRKIPQHLHFRAWNPHLALDGARIRVPQEALPWPAGAAGQRIAAVSAFGLSGTNAHIVIEEPPVPEVPSGVPASEIAAPTQFVGILPISAKKPKALSALAHAYCELLAAETAPELGEICRAAAVGRNHHEHRLAIVARNKPEALAQLDAYLAGQTTPGVASGRRPLDKSPPIVFAFSGQGPQWAGMGCGLLDTEPAFRRALEECDALLNAATGRSLFDELRADQAASRLDRTEIAQPVLFSVQVALAALWRSWGIEPSAVVGHSVGEVAAAHVAGALDLPDAMRLVCRRGQIMQQLTGKGRMAAVALSPDEGLARIRGLEDRLSIAAINAPRSIVLSGESDALDSVLSQLREEKVFWRLLPVDYAAHSPQTRRLGPELARALTGLARRPNGVPFLSSVTGSAMSGMSLDTDYWVRNMVEPVRFLATVQSLVASGHKIFLEVGPHPVLSSPIQQTLEASGRPGTILGSLRRDTEERSTLLASLAVLYAEGLSTDWKRIYPRKAPRVAVPTYPWQHQRFWLDVKPFAAPTLALRPEGEVPAHGQGDDVRDWLYELAWVPSEPEGVRELPAGTWLLLADASGVAEQLAKRLSRAGHTCVLLRADESLAAVRTAGDDVTGRAFRRVLDRLPQEAIARLRGVVHLWSLDATPPERTTATTVIGDQDLGTRSAVQLIQAFAAARGQPPPIWLVTRGTQAVGGRTAPIALAQAPLWAIGRTLAAEHPPLWGGLVDLDPDATAEASAADLLRTLSSSDREDQVAFARGQRHVARLGRITAKERTSVRIEPDASYLITGGLDGVGLEIARWLVGRGARHLVLVGRTPIPDREAWTSGDHGWAVRRRVAAIQELEDAGARVEFPSVDVSSEEQMTLLFERLGNTERRVAGVFHAASAWRRPDGRGLVGPLATTTASSFDVVLPPKVVGSWLLRERCRARVPDFVVFFSSGAALVGSAGQGNYAAANAFMDALAHDLSRTGVRALSVNWGPIADAGFGATEEGRAVFELWRRRGVMAISVSQMFEALEQLLSEDRVQAGVMRTDWSVLQAAYADLLDAPWASRLVSASPQRPRRDFSRVLADAPPRERFELLAAHIQELVVVVMGFGPDDAPELDQGLFDMGMDSLLALDLKNRLQASLMHDVPAAALFEHSTIALLTDYILRELLELSAQETNTPAARDKTDVVADIAELSEAEVERLLAERMAKGAR
jgi:acyl transferase domain-containing protein